MATDESKIIVKLEAEINKLTTQLNKANKRISNFEKKAARSARVVKAEFKGLDTALKVAIGAITLRQAARLSDTYTEIGSRLKLVTSSTEELTKAQQGVFAISQRTRQSFAATAELYQRLAQSTDGLVDNQDDLLSITETVNKAIAVSGVSSQAAQAAIVQLGQGLSAGALRGQEFNSVVEQTPRLAKALADGLGVNIGQLRELSKQGALTSDVVVRALQNQAQAIDTEFLRVNSTIGQAFQTLENTFVRIVGGAAEASGAQRGVTDAIIDFSKALNDPDIQAGINTIAVAAVDAFSALTSAVSTSTEVIKFLAEEVSAAVNGIASDDIVRLQDEAQKIQDLLDSGQFSPSRIRFFGQNGVVEYWSDDELNAELANINAAIDQARSNIKPLIPQVADGGQPASVAAPNSAATVTLPDAGAEKAIEKADALLSNLRRQVDLYGEVSKAAEIRYQIESGALDNITPLQRSMLEMEAELLDQLRMKEALTRELESVRIDSLTTEQAAVEQLQNKYRTLTEAVQQGLVSQEEAAAIAGNLAQRFEEANEKVDEMSEFTRQAARNMQDAFADFLFDPFDHGLDGMLKSFAQTLQRMAAEATAAKLFDLLGGGLAASGNPVLAAAGTIFSAGGRVNGGPVLPGFGYTVGERGPEMFVPNVAGMIVPSNEMSGGTQIDNINMSFPGITNPRDAKRAAGAAGRELSRAIESGRRYS